ncbi:response regulator [Mongoliibacter ruber]|uniref:Response regulator receiver domain-containing protein n=1 Tax=Mongoliibacter ruber TaxID=1750599 RepID=A0A2T0WTC9_9BACT|nr:response regulator [Mongoliibacter ruber]PRY89834.1 response regulator receiver domain-containing protein [Mongoliibacter ruber]
MRHKFILWIDDMQNWSHIVTSNLSILATKYDINLVVLPQLNGEDLEQIFMMYPFDLIVMDYHMEPFNGDKYIAQIREEEHLDNIPILFYSQDQNVDLNNLIGSMRNVYVTNRASVEDRIKEFIFPNI